MIIRGFVPSWEAAQFLEHHQTLKSNEVTCFKMRDTFVRRKSSIENAFLELHYIFQFENHWTAKTCISLGMLEMDSFFLSWEKTFQFQFQFFANVVVSSGLRCTNLFWHDDNQGFRTFMRSCPISGTSSDSHVKWGNLFQDERHFCLQEEFHRQCFSGTRRCFSTISEKAFSQLFLLTNDLRYMPIEATSFR